MYLVGSGALGSGLSPVSGAADWGSVGVSGVAPSSGVWVLRCAADGPVRSAPSLGVVELGEPVPASTAAITAAKVAARSVFVAVGFDFLDGLMSRPKFSTNQPRTFAPTPLLPFSWSQLKTIFATQSTGPALLCRHVAC